MQVDKLFLMKKLSDILRKKMIRRGYIEFSSAEAKIIVDAKSSAGVSRESHLNALSAMRAKC